jgi:uncharacterized delta-60 repeat protein
VGPRVSLVWVFAFAPAAWSSSACGRIGFQSQPGPSDGRLDASPGFSIDPGFGNDGVVVLEVGGVDNLGYSVQGVAVQPDGRIVVGGDAGTTANKDMLVARLLDSGALDPTFGAGGIVTVDVFPADGVRSVALQADGKIVAAGGGGTSLPDSAVIRLAPGGALDATFGNTSPGISVVTFPGAVNSPNGAYVGADGKIVFGGHHEAARRQRCMVGCRAPTEARAALIAARARTSHRSFSAIPA